MKRKMMGMMLLAFGIGLTPVCTAADWKEEGNVWRYEKEGSYATGWLSERGTWYYLDGGGAMATGWLNDGGTWYYLDRSGAMAADQWIGSYYVDQKGVWLQGYTAPFWVEEKEIFIPGAKKEYKIAVVNDLHIIVPDASYAPEYRQEVSDRYYGLFRDRENRASGDSWSDMAGHIHACRADGVVLNGDMIDFYSRSNLDCLVNGMKQLTGSVMYLRADHDLSLHYSEGISREECSRIHKSLWLMEEVCVQEFDDFLAVGINNNTSQLTDTALAKLKTLWRKGKPVILFVHVPLESSSDDTLKELSKKHWQNRSLLWGNDSFYKPNNTTRYFLNKMVDAKDSPVVAVVGGHLHFAFDGDYNDKIRQIVFDASYKGGFGMLEVKGR